MDKHNGRLSMNTRMKTIAICVGIAVAEMAAGTAYADSGVGVDTAIGNALNPYTRSSAETKDPDGLGQNEFSRSPTGFLQAEPNLIREPGQTSSGWLYRGSLEAGGIGVSGDKNAAKFREYKDLDSGLYLNNFAIEAENPASAIFVEVLGGGVAKDDQYYGLRFGRYNDWKVRAIYSESPHVFTTTYRNLWNGTGSQNLTLQTLAPGGTTSAVATDAAIQAAALATPYSELSINRKKGSVRFDINLTDSWKAFASYSNEKREGSRPFGLVMGAGGGTGGVEIPESINYSTYDLIGGLLFNDALNSLNLQIAASQFRNNVGTMTVDNPMFLAAANGITSFPRAVYDLYPNNDYYNVKGEYARAMPDFYKSRFTGVVSFASSRQNDSLIPSTSYAGASVNTIGGGSWDTLDSLSRRSADAKIDTTLIDLGLAMNPTSDLDVKAKIRYYETKNTTEYWACNPLTGQWGRFINDGSGAQIVNTAAYLDPSIRCNVAGTAALGLAPSAGNLAIRNIPFEYAQTNYTLGANYRIDKSHSVNAAYEREEYDREHRERKETWEDRIKLGYVNRALEGGTLRLSAETSQRRGSTYVADPYDEFYSAALGPLPTAAGTNVTSWIHINNLHRKFDLADRDQNVFNARFNYALREDLDAGMTLQWKDIKYPSSSYGRTGKQSQNSVSFDVGWRPSQQMSLYGYYSYQDGKMAQQGLAQNACVIGNTYYLYSDGSMNTTGTLTAAQVAAGITVIGNSGPVTAANFIDMCGTASATSPLYPVSRTWTMDQKDRHDVLGLGIKYDFDKAKLDLDYTYTKGKTGITYGYSPSALGLITSGAPTAAQLATLALIGNGYSDLIYETNAIDASVLVPISKATSLRFLAHYETGKIRDWHYDGVSAYPSPATNQQTYLDSGPQDYDVTVLGVLLKVDF